MNGLANNRMRLIIAGACNLACFYCHNEGQEKTDALLSVRLLTNCVHALKKFGVHPTEITVSGGEPLLHPELPEIVRLLTRLTAKVTMVSNGTLIGPGDLERLRHAGLTKLRLGVDSLNRRKPRPSPGFLDHDFVVEDLLDTACAIQLPVDLNVVLTKFNRAHVSEIVQLALDRKLSMKFFEHVDVDEYGTAGTPGRMASEPHQTFDEFERLVAAAVGFPVAFAPAAEFGAANLAGHVAGIELRYCKYLCDFDLCWVTGSRLDASGFTYNCMVNRGLDRIDYSMTDAEIVNNFSTSASRPCRAGAKIKGRG